MSAYVDVQRAGRWSWYVTVTERPDTGDGWIGTEAWAGHVFGTRSRARRVARRLLARELTRQRRVRDTEWIDR